jgi:23S rRNA pseudouridine1911/1915/1917 synthase
MTHPPHDTSHDTSHATSGGSVATVERVTIDAGMEGQRLDVVLARAFPGLSRARLQALIHAGAVSRADGATIEGTSLRVKPGEVYVVHVPAAVDPEPKGENIKLDIVYEDKAVVVLNKPAGLVVHPATGHQTGTLVNALIAHCGASLSGIGGVRRPGIVHRLDKDTSGLLVVAKTDAAHQSLSAQFAAHGADGRLERGYAALVWGLLTPTAGRIATSIGRKAHDRTRMAVVREEHGRAAATRYEVARAFPGDAPTTLVRCTLETGRTHQVRVHMTHIGHPLLGDATYGTGFKTRIAKLGPKSQAALASLRRQALHAELLAFEHPASGKAMRFEAALPADMAALIARLTSGS